MIKPFKKMSEDVNQTADTEEATQLPDPSVLMFYNNLESRILWIDSDIEKRSIDIVKYIQHFNREDRGIPTAERTPIRLMIHSDGGSLDIALAIIDAILISATPVYTINMGSAYSAGFYILIAGSRRFCTKHSTAMAHPGSARVNGNFCQIQSFAADYKRTINDLKAYVMEHTQMTEESLTSFWDSDLYMSADEQLCNGVVDEILTQQNQPVLF